MRLARLGCPVSHQSAIDSLLDELSDHCVLIGLPEHHLLICICVESFIALDLNVVVADLDDGAESVSAGERCHSLRYNLVPSRWFQTESEAQLRPRLFTGLHRLQINLPIEYRHLAGVQVLLLRPLHSDGSQRPGRVPSGFKK